MQIVHLVESAAAHCRGGGGGFKVSEKRGRLR